MTIALYLHVGYLVASDDFGVSWGFGVPRQPRKFGEPIFRHNGWVVFPWWMQPAKVAHRAMIWRLIRKNRKAGKL